MNDRDYLILAEEIAKKSDEPVGCGVIIVKGDQILGEEFNSQRADNVAVNHAEIKAIIFANKKLGNRKLEDCTIYCSCEPCAMCLVALSYARIPRIVFSKTMKQLFPEDPQSDLNPYEFIKQLNFTPQLEQLV